MLFLYILAIACNFMFYICTLESKHWVKVANKGPGQGSGYYRKGKLNTI